MEDLLRQHINPGQIEKAPKGFTSKVMNRIQIEAVSLRSSNRYRNKNFVPIISISVTILLILAALLLPGGESDSFAQPAVNLIKDIKVYLPEIDLISILRFNLPASFIYVFASIMILTLFDRALNLFFHREK